MNHLLDNIQYIKGVGPRRSKSLGKLDIVTVLDLLWHVPRSYVNSDQVDIIATLQDGDISSLRGRVVSTRLMRTRRGYQIFKAIVEDDSGTITAVWFNQAFLSKQIHAGQEILLKGKVKELAGDTEVTVSEYHIIETGEAGAPTLPIYPLADGLNQKTLHSLMKQALNLYLADYPEILSDEVRRHYQLCDIRFALANIHFPADRAALVAARRRLVFEELLLFKLQLAREGVQAGSHIGGIAHRPKSDLMTQVIQGMPFELTDAQRKVTEEIIRDLSSPEGMNRLLQGDVGSGKTAVASLAMAYVVSSGCQAVLMVPTEILAEQHFTSIAKMFSGTDTVIARLTGATGARERKSILEASSAGELDILVGTQALIQDGVRFNNLGLVVIDEQHRFGVRQRASLSNKGKPADVLVMTATPIPRTLALTLYGDLNVSVIDQLPPGRQPVKTKFIPTSSRIQAYHFIGQRVAEGDQAYVVCPLIEESENQDMQAAVSLYEELRLLVFPHLKVGLLHGRMKSSEKERIMSQFKTGHIHILVTTTVVEVGVDVRNASIIMIEQAERFGLSQLHQLRGRVGRGDQQAYCILVGDPKTDAAQRRLRAMEKTSDGFELANEDLTIRGPGDFWGFRQHGLHELKVADLLRDQEILQWAGEAARDYDLAQIITGPIGFYVAAKGRSSSEIVKN